MRWTALKLGVSVAVMPLSILLLGLTHHDIFFLTLLASLPFVILYWFDLGRQLRNAANPSPMVRILGVIMGVPQAFFGLVCAGIGAAIVIWVLYNTFVQRQPEFTGGLLSLGMGPALFLFGLAWLLSAFRRDPGGPDEA